MKNIFLVLVCLVGFSVQSLAYKNINEIFKDGLEQNDKVVLKELVEDQKIDINSKSAYEIIISEIYRRFEYLNKDAKDKKIELFDYLVSLGLDLNYKPENSYSYLQRAIRGDSIELVKYIVKKDDDISTLDDYSIKLLYKLSHKHNEHTLKAKAKKLIEMRSIKLEYESDRFVYPIVGIGNMDTTGDYATFGLVVGHNDYFDDKYMYFIEKSTGDDAEAIDVGYATYWGASFVKIGYSQMEYDDKEYKGISFHSTLAFLLAGRSSYRGDFVSAFIEWGTSSLFAIKIKAYKGEDQNIVTVGFNFGIF